jgi:hypothetical protein
MYSTIRVSSEEYERLYGPGLYATYLPELGPLVGLTPKSQERLIAALRAEGDVALRGIADLTCLEMLDLGNHSEGFDASDAALYLNVSDLSPLKNLTRLRMLHLTGTYVKDISPLRYLTSLEILGLAYTHVSDISPLENLTNLTNLNLGKGVPVSDLSPLRNLKRLERLWIDGIDSNSLAPLEGLPSLEILVIPFTNIQNITPLVKLKNLKLLDIRWSNISNESYLKLKEGLPNTIIVRYDHQMPLATPYLPKNFTISEKVEKRLREMGYIV